MNYTVGDTVRIQSREWIDAQEKGLNGGIWHNDGDAISDGMFQYAGKTARIRQVFGVDYALDIDNGRWHWRDWMFDPDYRPNEPLSPEDAIRAMLDGETLYSEAGRECRWASEGKYFALTAPVWPKIWDIRELPVLYRRPEKRKRLMTNWEVLAWASSADSHGWVVQQEGDSVWKAPQYFAYTLEEDRYRRAKMLPDLSGVDPDTVQGFEAETTPL